MHDFEFAEATKGMTAEEVLDYYRNLYHAEPLSTEHGIIANTLNDILPRMIVPPCKVGDTVYVIGRTYTECHLGLTPDFDRCAGCEDECDSRKSLVIREKKVKSISYDGSHFGALVDDGSTIYKKFGTSNRYSVFITKEEAEQVLAERKVL